MSISPYPSNVRVNQAGQVFRDGKYLGYVDKVQNWGNDHLARPEKGANRFFRTKTQAAQYILSLCAQCGKDHLRVEDSCSCPKEKRT